MTLLTVRICVLLLAAAPLEPRIWIRPFENPRADASIEYLEQALPALLAVAVSRSDKHAVVDRQHLNQVLAEQSLTLEGLTSPETRHKIGRLAGATVMINGSFVRQEPDLLLSMRATDLETGIVIAAAEDTGPAAQPGRLVSKLYRRLARDLDRRLPDLGPDQIDEAPLSNLHFMRGLGYYYSARYNQALVEFMEAAHEEKLADVSRLWLANAYMAQHKYSHAWLELSRLKRDASGNLPEGDVETKMRACEKHLRAGELDIIRNLAALGSRRKE